MEKRVCHYDKQTLEWCYANEVVYKWEVFYTQEVVVFPWLQCILVRTNTGQQHGITNWISNLVRRSWAGWNQDKIFCGVAESQKSKIGGINEVTDL